MPFITIDNLNKINFELTDYCNAACPMCTRHEWNGDLKKNVNTNHTTLDFIREKIGIKVIGQLNHILSCGTYGDAIMNPECFDIYKFFRENNKEAKIELFTNGGARDINFWKDLAKLNIQVTFSIDGLEDTNHLYRRKVKWNKLIENIKSFIKNGGVAVWEFLIFKHNEHQIEQAREFSKNLGFKKFIPKHTGRWKDYSDSGEYRDVNKIKVDDYYIEKPKNQQTPDVIQNIRPLRYYKDKEKNYKKIICKSYHKTISEIYIRANGKVSPCCWLGDIEVHEAKRLIEDYKLVDLNYTTLEKILTGSFFYKLEQGIYNYNQKEQLQTCNSCCGIK
jgi:MoaA/NifB/PqqE/SkfB family radical SAM enzyme